MDNLGEIPSKNAWDILIVLKHSVNNIFKKGKEKKAKKRRVIERGKIVREEQLICYFICLKMAASLSHCVHQSSYSFHNGHLIPTIILQITNSFCLFQLNL